MPEDQNKERMSFAEMAKADPIKANALNLGNVSEFSAPDIGRYMTYGSKTYGKLGYNPWSDNSKNYNDNTTAGHDIQRAWTGMWKLAGVGASDTFGFGVFGAEDNHKDFENVMANYSSTREGATQFWANTMLSSGYTIGIMGAIAAEELVYAGITALSGGLAAPTTVTAGASGVARGIFQAQKGMRALDKVGETLNVFNHLKHINNSRIYNSVKAGVKELGPLAETADWLRNAHKMQDLNGLQHTLGGAGAIARDARKIYLTHSESRLEANMTKDEILNEEIQNWHSKNPGQEMPEDIYNEIKAKADKAYGLVYNGNLGVIYLTNAMTFNGMFKGMRQTNKLFGLKDRWKVSGIGTDNVTVRAVRPSLINYGKNKISSLTAGNVTKGLIQQSMEGVQEVSQDILASSAKKYVLSDEQMRGNYFQSIYNSLGDTSLETFMSGMLMGMFASPVGGAIQAANYYSVGEGRGIWTKKGRIKQEEAFKQREQQAEVLTEFFNRSGSFLDEYGKNVFVQSRATEKMLEAAEKNDRKYFEDNRGEVFRIGLKSVLDHGMQDELIEHLESFGSYSAEELNHATGRTDITEDNKGEFIQKTNDYISRIKNYKEIYDDVQDTMINPIARGSLNISDPDYMKKKIRYHAFENLKEEMLYSREKLNEYKERMTALDKKLTSHPDSKFTTSDLSVLLTEEALSNEIKLLTEQIKSDKEYNLDEEADYKKRVKRLEALKQYQEGFKAYKKLDEGQEKELESARREMLNGFNGFVNVINEKENRVLNKNQFVLLADYLELLREQEYFQTHVETLMDPELSSNHLNRMEEALTEIEANKKAHILNSIESAEKRKVADEVISRMLDNNLAFDMNEIDDLVENGIMPSKIYNIKTHKEVSNEEYQIALKIAEKAYGKLTNKKLITTDSAYLSRKKSSSDKRTSETLVKQFGNAKLDKPISVESFIEKLNASNFLTITERQILEKIDAEGNVVLTTSADAPISINEDGDVVIDVRFSSSDFVNGRTPFEYLAVSGLLQKHFAKALENNPAYKSKVTSLMKQAKDAYFERNKESGTTKADIEALGIFSNPVHFLSESLNNLTFQDFLADVEDVTDAEDKSLWESFKNALRVILDKVLDGTLLDRALGLAQLGLTEESIDSIIQEQSEEVSEVEEAVEEKPEVEEGPVNKKQDLKDKLDTLSAKRVALEKERSNTSVVQFRKRLRLNNEIADLRTQIEIVEEDLNRLEEIENLKAEPEVSPSTTVDKTPVKQTTDNNKVAINNRTPFELLPEELQYELAMQYVLSLDNFDPTAAEELEATGLTPTQALIQSLSTEDIQNIQGLMQKFSYMKTISDFVSRNNSPEDTGAVETAPVKPTVVKETVTPTPEVPPIMQREKTLEDLKVLLPEAETVFTEKQLANRVARMNQTDTIEDLRTYLESVEAEIARIKRKKERQTQKVKDEFEQLRVQASENIDLLTPYDTLESNGNKFKVKRSDIQLIKELLPRIFTLPKNEFLNEVYMYLKNSQNIAANINSQSFTLEGTTKAEQRLSLIRKMKELTDDKTLSTFTINALNNYLDRSDIPFAIKRKNYAWRIVERKDVLKKTKRTTPQEQLNERFFPEPGGLYSIEQAEYLVYDWLRNNKINPAAMPVREDRTYTNESSPHTTTDGIADLIFEEYADNLERLGIKGMDVVESMISQYENLILMKSYFSNIIQEEQDRQSREEREAAEMEKEREDEIRSGLLTTSIQEQEELESSVTYQIITGVYSGNINDLNASDRKLYEELYPEAFEQGLSQAKASELEKKAADLQDKLMQGEIDRSNENLVRKVKGLVRSVNNTVEDVVTAYVLVNNPMGTLSEAQKDMLNKNIFQAILSPRFEGNVVVSKTHGAVRIIPNESNFNEVAVQELERGNVYAAGPKEFLDEIVDVLSEQEEYQEIPVDPKTDPAELKPVKEAYSEIFSNFSNSMTEADEISEADLKKSILVEINKCK